jgi:hypothetical protein
MHWLSVCLLAAGPLIAQTVQNYTYDVNGDRIRGSQTVSSKTGQTVRTNSINGGSVPIERVEERELRSDATGRTVERLVRRYTPEGQLVGQERVVVEEAKRPEGSTLRTTRFEGDINGASRMIERSTAEVRRDGTSTNSDVLIERPAADGTLQAAERRVAAERKSGEATSSTESVYRPDTNGRFVEIMREATEKQTASGRTTEQTQRYQANAAGRFELAETASKTAVKQADGTESVVVDLYAPFTPGLANTNGPKLKEQQVIERRTVAGGGYVETVSVRKPGISDPNRLGAAQKVSEKVCTGRCEAQP